MDKCRRVMACIKCGSTLLDFTPGDGFSVLDGTGIGPIGGIALCKKCGHLGGPIIFENRREHKKFLKHLSRLMKRAKAYAFMDANSYPF